MKILIKLLLLIITAITIYLLYPRSSDKLLYIPKKDDIYPIEAILLQDTPLSSIDLKILYLLDAKDGWVRLDKSDNNLLKIYQKILKNKREKSRKVVVFGGDTIYNILKKIAKQTNLSFSSLYKEYFKISNFNEGEILAKKYNIPYKATPRSIISYMIYKSHNISREIAKNRDILIPSTKFKDYLTIASLIEKETQYYKEMPLISAVIHNRLKKGMKLQLDASLNYGKNLHKIVTHNLIKEDRSRYNTYKHKGLPPSPICSPSITALRAAFYPANVNYLYFVKSGNRHKFSVKYKTHISKVKVYKKNLKEYRAKKINQLLSQRIDIKLPQITPNKKFNLSIK